MSRDSDSEDDSYDYLDPIPLSDSDSEDYYRSLKRSRLSNRLSDQPILKRQRFTSQSVSNNMSMGGEVSNVSQLTTQPISRITTHVADNDWEFEVGDDDGENIALPVPNNGEVIYTDELRYDLRYRGIVRKEYTNYNLKYVNQYSIIEASIMKHLRYHKVKSIPQLFDVNTSRKNGNVVVTSAFQGAGYTLTEWIANMDFTSTYQFIESKLDSIIQAVKEIHNVGVVHNNLIPDNIMIDDHGDVQLINFDMATYVNQIDPAHPRHLYSIPGTSVFDKSKPKDDYWILGMGLVNLIRYKRFNPEIKEKFKKSKNGSRMLLSTIPITFNRYDIHKIVQHLVDDNGNKPFKSDNDDMMKVQYSKFINRLRNGIGVRIEIPHEISNKLKNKLSLLVDFYDNSTNSYFINIDDSDQEFDVNVVEGFVTSAMIRILNYCVGIFFSYLNYEVDKLENTDNLVFNSLVVAFDVLRRCKHMNIYDYHPKAIAMELFLITTYNIPSHTVELFLNHWINEEKYDKTFTTSIDEIVNHSIKILDHIGWKVFTYSNCTLFESLNEIYDKSPSEVDEFFRMNISNSLKEFSIGLNEPWS
jgi:serine/threonine protein kinase